MNKVACHLLHLLCPSCVCHIIQTHKLIFTERTENVKEGNNESEKYPIYSNIFCLKKKIPISEGRKQFFKAPQGVLLCSFMFALLG